MRPLGAAPLTTSFVLGTIDEDSVAVRAGMLGCLQPPSAFRSGINTDGEFISFFGQTFLGLPNPMEFPVRASRWEVSGYRFKYSMTES